MQHDYHLKKEAHFKNDHKYSDRLKGADKLSYYYVKFGVFIGYDISGSNN